MRAVITLLSFICLFGCRTDSKHREGYTVSDYDHDASLAQAATLYDQSIEEGSATLQDKADGLEQLRYYLDNKAWIDGTYRGQTIAICCNEIFAAKHTFEVARMAKQAHPKRQFVEIVIKTK
jgi:hypothetical protein